MSETTYGVKFHRPTKTYEVIVRGGPDPRSRGGFATIDAALAWIDREKLKESVVLFTERIASTRPGYERPCDEEPDEGGQG